MKKICFLILAALISTAAMAQTAKSVLDRLWHHPHQRQEVPRHHTEGYRLVRRQDHVDLYERQRGSECQQSH